MGLFHFKKIEKSKIRKIQNPDAGMNNKTIDRLWREKQSVNG